MSEMPHRIHLLRCSWQTTFVMLAVMLIVGDPHKTNLNPTPFLTRIWMSHEQRLAAVTCSRTNIRPHILHSLLELDVILVTSMLSVQ